MSLATLLKGRVALVTGSTTGIGYGIIKTLSAAGATTIMHGLLPEAELRAKADALAEETGNSVTYQTANLMDAAEIRRMVGQVQDRHGKLDILVNNAGIQFVSSVQDFPEDKWDAIVQVVMNAPFHASKAALPAMLEQGWGRIVNTGSMHATVASPFKSAYNAAKHGVAGFTKTLALEVATSGVTVNAVCPGYVMTELIEKQLANQAATRGIPVEKVISDVLLVDQPIKRFVRAEEIGAMVRHLCTDDAGAITGACLAVDGGWTAR
ncbi:HBD1 [Auxenochlorella protothecoides x Auxenochlorella symbiontica]